MMTQGVMTQAALLTQTTAGVSSAKSTDKTGSFEMIMDQNLNHAKNTVNHDQSSNVKRDTIRIKDTGKTKLNTNDKDTGKTDSKLQSTGKGNEAGTAEKTKVDGESKPQAEAEQVKETGSGTELKEELDGPKNLSQSKSFMEQLMGMLQAIQETVMETLNLSQEELNQLLTDQGLTLGDLTETDGLKQLILSASGKTDVFEFLTNGDLAAKLSNLTQMVEAIKDGTGLAITGEQIDAAAASLMEKPLTAEDNTDPLTEISVDNDKKPMGNQLEDSSKTNATKGQEEKGTNALNKPEIEVIKVSEAGDTSENTQTDTHREKAKEADATKQFETFLNNLTGNNQEVKVEFTGDTVQVTELREIANQIIERIRVVMKPEQTSMELQLNPEHLGRVNLNIQSKEGAMTAQFVVQNELAKEAIEGQLQILKDTLNLQGIKVEAIEVTVASYSFGQSGQTESEGQPDHQNKGRGHKITLEEAMAMKDIPEAASPMEEISGVTGTNIDMTA